MQRRQDVLSQDCARMRRLTVRVTLMRRILGHICLPLRRLLAPLICKRMPDDARNARNQARHRARMREQGLRLLQAWVPDTSAPGFAKEYRRQAKLVAKTYHPGGEDADLLDFWERIAEEDRQDAWR
jgi:hypothetical protein